MSKFYKESEIPTPKCPGLEKNRVVGDSWSAFESNGAYFVEYISGQLGGELREIEISEEDYKLISDSLMSVDSLLIKYGAI